MTVIKNFWFFIIGVLSLLISCSAPQESILKMPAEGEFFEKISDYGVFTKKQNALIPNAKLIKYEVINSLFTDYAEKDRFVYVPDGLPAPLNKDGYFDFPAGSMLVKNFYYTKDQIEKQRIVETRLLIKDSNEWRAISYVWDEGQNEAQISKVGDVFPLSINHNDIALNFDYIVPNKNQCKSCHNNNEKIDPIGFKFSNLNASISENGTEINQLAFLESKGVISLNDFAQEMGTMVAYEDQKNNIEQRALAYLDVNCGHCHRPEGPGNTSGLFLQYNETRTNHLGYCKGPVAAGKGSGGRRFDIVPGSPDSSILVYRMASRDPSVMMPELGRSLAHTEGISLVSEWINGIEFDCFAN